MDGRAGPPCPQSERDAGSAHRRRAKPRLVVVGNGMAGMRTVEELLKLDASLYDITVFGAEPQVNYNRILLSPLLAGEKTVEDIILHTREWYAAHGIRLHAGDPVVAIDRHRRRVRSAAGRELGYDRLLLATGSKPFIIPVPGAELPGVIAFRDIQDVETMLAAARSHRKAVVIGGGLLGLEAANGLKRQGMDVTVVHVMDRLMERQLDPPAAALLREALEKRGIRILLEAHTERILGAQRVSSVRLKDGRELAADLVVMAVGIRPNVELARQAGLYCDRAIVVDDTLQTLSDPRIYAVGECVQHRQVTFGLVAPIWEQARVCATHLAGHGHRRYVQAATSTKLKVSGIDLFSAGDFVGGEGTEDLVFRDPRRGSYKRLVLKDRHLVGAVLYGDVGDGSWYFDLIERRTDVSRFRDRLVFGRAFCEALAR
ncbi:FAD-dependent oxidoreductase [Sinimarinibacterium sp. HSW-8]|uniref:FAD-dependent oxidoreductase n=1 Tax=Sinimarinibacterium thermocellulolyticum TaxID=3170016 RepID=A0ABV2ACR2_9GAMM